MSYLFTFMAGMLLCLSLVLLQFGHADAAYRGLFSMASSLFMAWVLAKIKIAAERKS